ncbi:CDP-glycerol glycerophosphotransferase family protein [Streptomyces sp. NPDC127110]|uniref:bifunctional glycosyltransferase/CDP-glycerol:glycerophosphate glycerophosphotransferase n=1 Tax=Streptomyces sp. NPDC127110 TaxID=3345362 RepID=UPI00363625A6
MKSVNSSLLSVVVPFQNVEIYLEECLESIARQTHRELDVVLVDDGSTDGSSRIAQEFCLKDPRFGYVRQEANGPGHARNTGLRHCREDSAYLAFVDGDDILPAAAYSILLAQLRSSGSDFVSGNVKMMNSRRIWQSPLHASFTDKKRTGTHITRHDSLIYDRTVWNKVFRRSFWDGHGIAFPEGVLYEDIWVNMYAHHKAGQVDVLTDHVYFWRRREGNAAPSITQRLGEVGNLRDRFTAIGSVSAFLAENPATAPDKRKYDLGCLTSDLMLHLKFLPESGEEYQKTFMELSRKFLDGVDEAILQDLEAPARVKWHLVRAGRVDLLLDVLEIERTGGGLPVRRIGGRRYLDYPGLGDRTSGVKKSAYRLGKEFTLHASLSDAAWEGLTLTLRGSAYVRNLDVDARHKSFKAIALVHPGSGRKILTRAKNTYTPQTTEHARPNRHCYDWAGFESRIDVRRLKRKGQWVEGTWNVAAGVLGHGLLRHRGISRGTSGSGANPPYVYVDKNLRVVPLFHQGRLKIRVERVRCRITRHRIVGGELELHGVHLAPTRPESGTLRVTSLDGNGHYETRAWFTPGGEGWSRFVARIPLDRLIPGSRTLGNAAETAASDTGSNGWQTTLHLPGRKRPLYPVMAEGVADGRYRLPSVLQSGGDDREITVHRNGSGYVVLFERRLLPVAHTVSWWEDGLEIIGTYAAHDSTRDEHLVLRAHGHNGEHRLPLLWNGNEFRTVVAPATIKTFVGSVPLASGRWDVLLRRQERTTSGRPADTLPDLTLKAERELVARLGRPPRPGQERRYEVQTVSYDKLSLLARSAMPIEARGPYRQRKLRTELYPAARSKPLRPAVLYDSFRGTQYSDSPRALHEELAARGLPLEHLWVVRDDQVVLPPPLRAVRLWSPEWYEALATSRYVVANNHLPEWFEKRPGQVVVQTWHGTPLKKIGHDIETPRFADHRYLERVAKEVLNWDLLVSPNSFSTPILRRAFDYGGEVAECGYPRNDLLCRPGTGPRAAEVRRRLGLPDGKRVVLYAPTWRDDQYYAPGKYRLDFRVDLDDARARLGDDHVLLVRRHPNVVDPVPGAGDGFVYDVSAYPDMAELYLIADLVVTDYSSVMFDFAVTGRPVIFFTYDFEHYRDTLRGFYFDFVGQAPGPLVHSSSELITAIRDADRLRETYADRMRAFQRQFCHLDDGRASARLGDRILALGGDLVTPPPTTTAAPAQGLVHEH